MSRALAIAAVSTFLGGVTFAQTFVLADVHVSPPGTSSSMRGGFLPGGRYELKAATMVDLIATAWNVPGESVYGGPSWLESDRFDIIAKAPPASTEAERAVMLRALLADRFKLVAHDDKKPLTVFALTQGKRNPQLREATGTDKPDCQRSVENGPPYLVVFACRNMPMAEFARLLGEMDAGSVDHQAVDMTGLKGEWDFTIKFTPRQVLLRSIARGDQTPATSLFDALDKQLGLKLASQKYPMPVVAVDSVNRTPTENAPGVTKNLPQAPSEFEVAAIKPSKPGTEPKGGFRPDGRVDLQGVTLKDLIGLAWELDDDRIAGGPKWVDSDRFDIVAKAPVTGPTSAPPVDTLRVMLRALLADRFKLTTHNEDRPVAVYELLAGKRPKLKEADPSSRSGCKLSLGTAGTGTATVPLRIYTCQNMTMGQFAEMIRPAAAAYVDHAVVDLTELKGGWDFVVSWTGKGMQVAARARKPEGESSADPTGGLTVFEAIDKQLGLKLEGGRKHPMPVMVVDRAEEPEADK